MGLHMDSNMNKNNYIDMNKEVNINSKMKINKNIDSCKYKI